MRLEVKGLRFSYAEKEVLKGLDLRVPDGQITALVGRNGCGKSTLLKLMARLLEPAAGEVLLDGHPVSSSSTRQVAQRLAILPQSPSCPSGLTIESLVAMGRYPHQNLLGQIKPEDRAAIESALNSTGLQKLRGRRLSELSGGQRQRAWIAVCLAQQTDIMLLDEPTTYLDMAHQLEVLELLKELNQDEGKTIVMVVHDLNHAAQYADHLVALVDGTIRYSGPPGELLGESFFAEVFGVRA